MSITKRKNQPRTRSSLPRAPSRGKSPADSVPAAISLGSNLGDRRAALARARVALAALHSGPRAPRVSALYETEPVGCAPGTPAFLNAVVEIHTTLGPAALLRHLRRIEREAGRPPRRRRNSPRPLDLDLIHAGAVRLDTPTLTLPHPRAASRRFVLRPLADLSPDLVLPGRRRSVSALLAALPASPAVRRVATRW
jgi:2-amino-4-hydroxy-6-hydroxymethyldihydropteridine diphosphokinase